MMPNFQKNNSEESEKLIGEFGGKKFGEIFEKSSAVGEDQIQEFSLKVSLITNFIINAQKHIHM